MTQSWIGELILLWDAPPAPNWLGDGVSDAATESPAGVWSLTFCGTEVPHLIARAASACQSAARQKAKFTIVTFDVEGQDQETAWEMPVSDLSRVPSMDVSSPGATLPRRWLLSVHLRIPLRGAETLARSSGGGLEVDAHSGWVVATEQTEDALVWARLLALLDRVVAATSLVSSGTFINVSVRIEDADLDERKVFDGAQLAPFGG